MKNYDIFAPVYDLAMGDQKHVAASLLTLFKLYAPEASSLLELGCGSGSLLKVLSRYYDCLGIDLSAEMIRIARRKVPKADFLVGDISEVKTSKKFDIVLCAFDTINHLQSFKKWQAVFKNAYDQLNPGGLFIFDINTTVKIEKYDSEPPYVEQTKESVAIFEVSWSKRPRYIVDVRVFKKLKKNKYTLHQMEVNGITFPVSKILKTLSAYFKKVKMVDFDLKQVSNNSEEIYFICRGLVNAEPGNN